MLFARKLVGGRPKSAFKLTSHPRPWSPMPDNADSALVDANIFLRYLTEDLPEQAEKARDLLSGQNGGRRSS